MAVKISALSSAGAIADANLMVIVQSGTTYKIAWSAVIAEIISSVEASVISSGNYTSSPATDGQITFSDTTGLYPGMALRIEQSSTYKYYLITSVTTNTNITVAGPALGATTIDSIATLDPSRVVQVDLFFPGLYEIGGTTTTLVDDIIRSPFRWAASRAYLVRAGFSHNTADGDSSNQPDLNVTVDGSTVFSTDVTMPNSSNFVDTEDGDADVGAYLIEHDDTVEVEIAAAPGDLDARDLTVSLVFILE